MGEKSPHELGFGRPAIETSKEALHEVAIEALWEMGYGSPTGEVGRELGSLTVLEMELQKEQMISWQRELY